MSNGSSISVRHDPDARRFFANVEGGRGVIGYERDGDRIVFTHASVPPDAEGQGVGSAIAREALKYARDNRLQAVPHCPFMVAYMQSHPEEAELP